MTTRAEVQEAHNLSRRHRVAMARMFLRLDESKASEGDRQIAQRVMAAAHGDGEDLDRAIASRTVVALFDRGILYFEGHKP